MASKEQLRRKLAQARKAERASDRAVKELVDLHVPGPARKARLRLLARLRKIARRMAARIPRLKARLEAKRRSGADKALAWAKRQVGTTESPPYSNRGPFPITECQTFTIGYDGVPWCGCFVAYAAIHEGGAKVPNKARLAYTPYICADASAGVNGLRRVGVSEIQKGDLVVFDFDGGGADHVEIALGPAHNTVTDCIGGNTSPSAQGSQSNGGGVYRRQRPISQVACVARPDY